MVTNDCYQASTKTSLIQQLNRLWKHLSRRRQKQIGLLFVLMIIASIAEMISIGAILPFLGVLTAPEQIFAHPSMQPVIVFFGFESPSQLMLPLTISFILAALVAGLIRLTLLFTTTRFSFAAGADISIDIYRRTLYQPYGVHISRNTSELINGIIKKTEMVIYGVLMPVLMLISSGIMLIAILFLLLLIDPVIAIAAIMGFGGIYLGIIWATRRRLTRSSKLIADESTQVIKSLQEGLGGIRDILIDGSQDLFCRIYRSADLPLRQAQGDIHIISGSPRFLIEALGMGVIALVAYIMAQNADGIMTAIPVLGAFAIGAQRLLPVLQQGYGAVSGIKGAEFSMIDTLDLLDQPISKFFDDSAQEPLLFEKEIKLNNLGFRYGADLAWIFNDVNFSVPKGSRIGFIGETGSGKSTLLDIIMGLLPPTEGTLSIDGQPISAANVCAWQAHVAHVPQNIYLADSSLYENIAFGIPKDEIDYNRVRQAAKQAQISDVIESWPKQYDTFVGERGIRLSGGQRQRIAIARALYKKANLVIFDEATSALDNETEQAVMSAIDSLGRDLTIFIIAHRLTTLRNCDQIIELGNGGVSRIGNYDDIVNF